MQADALTISAAHERASKQQPNGENIARVSAHLRTPKQIAKLLGEDDDAEGCSRHSTDNPPPPSLDSLHDALEAAIAAQEQAYCLLEGAIGETKESKMGMFLAVHNKALELRLKAEAQYRDALKQHRSG
jgi:hypothetical protein